jgi:NAD(P)-dependent dehydrogenase (short-subunit alcohol dehydrogenase family)
MADSVIAVTGSSRGIGAAIARELAARRFTVGCLSRGGGLPAGEEDDERYICATCDVTDEASVRKALAFVAKEAGGLHGLVNNAGVHREARSHSLTNKDFDDMMVTNARSVMMVSREAHPHMKGVDGARIVNIGSFFDKLGVPKSLAYCASKAAVGAITRCLATEWARDGITVVNVAPGFIETDLNREALADARFQEWIGSRSPARRAGTADEVARLVASLFSDNIPFMTGETIYLDGGQSMTI